jgi:hypothetical protein
MGPTCAKAARPVHAAATTYPISVNRVKFLRTVRVGVTEATGAAANRYVVDVVSPFRAIGSDRTRIPVASKIAAPTAGAIAMIGVSPAPIDG